MRKYKLHFISTLFFSFFISCNSNSDQDKMEIAKKNDYKSYLVNDKNIKLENAKKDIDFWQKKYDNNSNQYTYLIKLAGLYSQLFEITGNIENLYTAEKLLLECNARVKDKKASIHRAIARNYISQHRFKEALIYLDKALVLGENKLDTQKMLFDVYMELGSFDLAKNQLTIIQDFNDFDYLIRLAKWNDHIGQLDDAIKVMEKAMVLADNSKNQELKEWIYSNLADFYGHADRVEDSYAYYLKTLELDKNNMYALKGIAWIAFSNDRNPEKSLEIIDYIEKKHLTPDLYLFKSDVYDFQNNDLKSKNAIKKYLDLLSKNNYGDMYNKYNVLLYNEFSDKKNQALEIAQIEINNRPTPESYDLLAWSYYNLGDFEKAYEIARDFTINKSHEPSILFHNELILKANNKLTKENSNKEELLESLYELGPNLESQIKNI
ncbi:tetratricopeptide repeat protein [Flavobacterium okayamense]|nr:hypothetical protein [Flavobacterium okayamense]